MKSDSKLSLPTDAPRLYTRRQAANLLGSVDVSTIRRLERSGKLKPIRLTRPRGQVFFSIENLKALVEAASNDQ
jgi:predicted site-specific integrase-resolvase